MTTATAAAPEERYGRSSSELGDVRARVIAAGHSPAVAAGLVAWLLAGGDLGGGVSVATRSRYRRILRELE